MGLTRVLFGCFSTSPLKKTRSVDGTSLVASVTAPAVAASVSAFPDVRCSVRNKVNNDHSRLLRRSKGRRGSIVSCCPGQSSRLSVRSFFRERSIGGDSFRKGTASPVKVAQKRGSTVASFNIPLMRNNSERAGVAIFRGNSDENSRKEIEIALNRRHVPR